MKEVVCVCVCVLSTHSPICNKTDGSGHSEDVPHHALIEGIHGTHKDDETLFTLKHLC